MLEWAALSSSRGSSRSKDPESPALQVGSLPLSHLGSPSREDSFGSEKWLASPHPGNSCNHNLLRGVGRRDQNHGSWQPEPMLRRQCGHLQSPVLWEWSHFPQTVQGAGFVSPDQPIPFWFASSKTKFIIHKPENLCNSPGQAMSFKGSLCSDLSPSQDCSLSTAGGFLWACLSWDVTSEGKERTDWRGLQAGAHQAPLTVGTLQARTLQWVAISFSRGSSQPRGRTLASCIPGGVFIDWATREVLASPSVGQMPLGILWRSLPSQKSLTLQICVWKMSKGSFSRENGLSEPEITVSPHRPGEIFHVHVCSCYLSLN